MRVGKALLSAGEGCHQFFMMIIIISIFFIMIIISIFMMIVIITSAIIIITICFVQGMSSCYNCQLYDDNDHHHQHHQCRCHHQHQYKRITMVKTIRRGTLDLGYSSLAASRRQSIGEEPDYKQVVMVMIMVNRKREEWCCKYFTVSHNLIFSALGRVSSRECPAPSGNGRHQVVDCPTQLWIPISQRTNMEVTGIRLI